MLLANCVKQAGSGLSNGGFEEHKLTISKCRCKQTCSIDCLKTRTIIEADATEKNNHLVGKQEEQVLSQQTNKQPSSFHATIKV